MINFIKLNSATTEVILMVNSFPDWVNWTLVELVFFHTWTCRFFWKATTEFKAFEQIVSFNRLHEATIEEQQKKKKKE